MLYNGDTHRLLQLSLVNVALFIQSIGRVLCHDEVLMRLVHLHGHFLDAVVLFAQGRLRLLVSTCFLIERSFQITDL
jgi:hypothetical protein